MPASALANVGMAWQLRFLSYGFMTWWLFDQDRFHGNDEVAAHLPHTSRS